MRTGKFWGICLVSFMILVTSGCISQEQYDDLKAQNRVQQDRITELGKNSSALELQRGQCQSQLQTLQDQSSASINAKDADIALLEDAIKKKNSMIGIMTAQLLQGGMQLPIELSEKLQEFAEDNDMVVFDVNRGVLKFKSDLLFDSGSDVVKIKSLPAIKTLSDIMNSSGAEKFDIIIAGHTDDQPIKASLTKHPTNWHLSAHRAISVVNALIKNGLQAKRMSVRGFGEFRPAAANKPNKGGHKENRRVEIYIVPAGA